MKTVTFGTISAPFHAIRTSKQLAIDEGYNLPLAALAAKNEFYADDLLSGADCIDEDLEKQNQIIKLMQLGKFELRKWASNHPALLKNIPPNFAEMYIFLEMEQNNSLKILGLHWNPTSYNFFYKVNILNLESEITKRKNVPKSQNYLTPWDGFCKSSLLRKSLFKKFGWRKSTGRILILMC